ncbi:MAG: hypothetical protein GXO96_04950 [Nitrospirae bacterium]|nr:hypothetical protein [Candidatus Manganitrophaceae bacterium]
MKYTQARIALFFTIILLFLSGCASYRPTQINNVCAIFRGETDWYEAARDANQKWGTPIWVMMAIMHQESRFIDDAQPPRPWFLFIPLPRRSSAYGYAQAQKPAWADYIKYSGNRGADRDDFDDAIDFVGWYTHVTQRRLGISKWDVYHQYLAYHEGRGGYARGTWKKKDWLKKVAKKVKNKSAVYNAQLKSCKAELDDAIDGLWFF